MQTSFTPEQLRDPAIATAERILRKCVHCGFCNATCPTYQLLGDELDGPRGRIYQMKQVLEGAPATARRKPPPGRASSRIATWIGAVAASRHSGQCSTHSTGWGRRVE